MQHVSLESHRVVGNLEIFVRHHHNFNELLKLSQTKLVVSKATAEFLYGIKNGSSILCQRLVDLDLLVERSENLLGLSNLLHGRGF